MSGSCAMATGPDFVQPAAVSTASPTSSVAYLFMSRIFAYYAKREAHPTGARHVRAVVGRAHRARAAAEPDADRRAWRQGRPSHDLGAADRLYGDSRGR